MKTAMLPIELRESFDLIDLSFTKEQAQAEAARCMQCTTLCDKCVEVCPNRANQTFLMQPVDVMLPRLGMKGEALALVGYERFQVAQERQIVNINDFCNECGDCTTFCVHHGQPWLDKPRLFLNEKDFLAEDHNAYRIVEGVIRHRDLGRESSLARERPPGLREPGRARDADTRFRRRDDGGQAAFRRLTLPAGCGRDGRAAQGHHRDAAAPDHRGVRIATDSPQMMDVRPR